MFKHDECRNWLQEEPHVAVEKRRKVLRSKEEELNNNLLYQEVHYTRTQHDVCFLNFMSQKA
jgi:hypothetical protein